MDEYDKRGQDELVVDVGDWNVWLRDLAPYGELTLRQRGGGLVGCQKLQLYVVDVRIRFVC